MKSQKIVASFIAGFGVYLVLTTAITAATGFLGAFGVFREMREGWTMVAAQYAAFAVPLAVGSFLVFGAHRLAGVVSQAAHFSDEHIILPDPMALLRVILACVGVFVVINSGSFICQLGYDVFVVKAASGEIGEQSQRQIPGTEQLVALVIQFVAAVILIRRTAVVTHWFERRWQSVA